MIIDTAIQRNSIEIVIQGVIYKAKCLECKSIYTITVLD